MKLSIKLNPTSVGNAINALRVYSDAIDEKVDRLAKRLADYGYLVAAGDYAAAMVDGPNDVNVTIEKTSTGYNVVASGQSVLFIEFGTGIIYSSVKHPMNNEFGMGPGTWYPPHYSRNSSGQLVENWFNDRGWHLPKEKGGGLTYGNPPSMSMYKAAQDIRQEIPRIALEVFSS